MKNKIHPEYHNITIVMTDGSTYTSSSTIKRKDFLKLDMDSKSHAFWSGQNVIEIVDQTGQRAKFKKRFEYSRFA